jgi:putative FmdB family regulatory protein
MPTYTYRCSKCSYEFDELQKITAKPLVVCPSCKRRSLIRLIEGGAGVVFKGSGFYITDYKKSSSASHTPRRHEKQEKADTHDSHDKREHKTDKPTDVKGGGTGEKK